jgi:hypothetical protein
VWHSYSMGVAVSGVVRHTVLNIGGYPAMAIGHTSLKYARAIVANPTSSSDWIVHSVDSDIFWQPFCAAVELGGKPAICYTSSTGGMRFAWATTQFPSSPSDWVKYTIDETYGGWPAITLLDGKPIIAYQGSGEMYARSTTTTPVLSSDWVCHTVDTGTNSGDMWPGAVTVIDGKPVLAYLDDTEDDLLCARALTATPSSSSDWQIHKVTDHGSSHDGVSAYLVTIGEYDGKIGIAYGSTFSYFARSVTSTPTSSSDWAIHQVCGEVNYGFKLSLSSYYGVPIFAHVNAIAHVAASTAPSSGADWDRTVAAGLDGWPPEFDQPSLFVDGTKPSVSFTQSASPYMLYYAWAE